MKKYKKIITALILGLICAILPFVGVAKAKALTAEDITDRNDLKNTTWRLNNVLNAPGQELVTNPYNPNDTSTKYLVDTSTESAVVGIAEINGQQQIIPLLPSSGNDFIMSFTDTVWSLYVGLQEGATSGTATPFYNFETYESLLGPTATYYLQFGDFLDGRISAITANLGTWDFVTWLKQNATLVLPEPTIRTIPFRISLITNVFGDELEYINSSIINLPVYDDTVSFTVSFENNKMINGQIEHPESADELGELTFSNGERVFYTIYYNATNIEFKLYFYGDQLFLYEAVMYNTEVLDSGGNYLATVATYSEGISDQEMQTLKNSGIYEASFDITIPQEAELVTDAQLMLEIGILEGSEPPGFDNITNIMTGIFTLVSSFLSIQLGFITLGQIIGLILAIGVIFFIFYVWNGGRNGN